MPDDSHGGGRISFGNFKIENLPGWLLTAVVAVLTVAGLTFAWYRWVHDPQAALQRHLQQTAVIEYGQHIAEAADSVAVLFDDVRGKLTVSVYPDGCTLIARMHRGKARTRLILDLDKQEALHDSASRAAWLVPVVEASGGRCLNPHPGPFDTWYGERRGCAVQVWRRWRDGCEHWQWLDSCRNVWDSNTDGSPRVSWTRCTH